MNNSAQFDAGCGTDYNAALLVYIAHCSELGCVEMIEDSCVPSLFAMDTSDSVGNLRFHGLNTRCSREVQHYF